MDLRGGSVTRIQELINAGFAAAALASAALPVFAYGVWPGIDFEWCADVGKPLAAPVETAPAPRAGGISDVVLSTRKPKEA
jgi:hypothetical protein